MRLESCATCAVTDRTGLTLVTLVTAYQIIFRIEMLSNRLAQNVGRIRENGRMQAVPYIPEMEILAPI